MTPVPFGMANGTKVFMKLLCIKELDNLESERIVEISYLVAAVQDEAVIIRRTVCMEVCNIMNSMINCQIIASNAMFGCKSAKRNFLFFDEIPNTNLVCRIVRIQLVMAMYNSI